MFWDCYLVFALIALSGIHLAFCSEYKDAASYIDNGEKPIKNTNISEGRPLCGGWINGTNGFIQTPNFPHQFPVPISCKWLFYVPPGKKLVLYLTQYFLKGLQVWEFDEYEDEDHNKGQNLLGAIDYELDVRTVTAADKRYLVLKLQVEEMGNIHLRVPEFLLDVYGFNITYEVSEQNASLRDCCNVFSCSFLGNCLATSDFEKYQCHCFPKFHGEFCQYGPQCGPEIRNSICKNGGKCRYFQGSLVNMCDCPPDYYGTHCDHLREETDCGDLNCNQHCRKTVSGNLVCACQNGFRLLDDNATCELIERVRAHISIAVKKDSPIHICDKKEVEQALIKQVSNFFSEYLAYIGTPKITRKIYGKMETSLYLFFTFDKKEKDKFQPTLNHFISTNTICGGSVAEIVPVWFETVLHSMSVHNQDSQAVIEGRQLSLSCTVKGPPQANFFWYKDGYPIDVNKSFRSMWEERIPTPDEEEHMFIITIERAHYLDEGTFSCRVNDSYDSLEKFIYVDIAPIPHIVVKPKLISTKPGNSAHFSCLSSDDNRRSNFTYTWLQNGLPIGQNGINGELVEDLHPTGSRLNLHNIKKASDYTCLISSISGKVQDKAKLTLIYDKTRVCEAELYAEANWEITAKGVTDVTSCPLKAVGQATRTCHCSGSGSCYWTEPNFLECNSVKLGLVAHEVRRLLLGYKRLSTDIILNELRNYPTFKKGRMPVFSGDMEKQMLLLRNIYEYVRRYGSNSAILSKPENVLRMASMILEKTCNLTREEHQHTKIGHYTVQLLLNIVKDSRWLQTRFTRNASFSINTQEICLHATITNAGQSSKSVEILHNSQYVNVSTKWDSEDHETQVTITVAYDNLEELLDTTNKNFPGYEINSKIVLAHLNDTSRLIIHQNLAPFLISFKHLRPFPVEASLRNASICVTRELREAEDGNWVADSCYVQDLDIYVTICRCYWPGHHALMTSTFTKPPTKTVMQEKLHDMTIVGLLLSLCAFFITLIIHLVLWRTSNEHGKVARANFLCIMGVIILIHIGVLEISDGQVICEILRAMLFVFFLAAESFLSMELMHILWWIKKKQMRKIQPLKDICIGWGIPVLILGATIGVLSLHDLNLNQYRFCWASIKDTQLYFLLGSACAIYLVYLIILGAVIKEIHQRRTDPQMDRKKCIFCICQSFFTMTCLITVTVFSIRLISSSDKTFERLFVADFIAMSVGGLILRLVSQKLHCPSMSTTFRWPCWNIFGFISSYFRKRQKHSADAAGYYKGFVRPAIQANGDNRSEQDNDERIKRDKLNYTKEKKDQLRALLGSSASSTENSNSGLDCVGFADRSCLSFTLSDTSAGEISHGGIRTSRIKPVRGRSFIIDDTDDPNSTGWRNNVSRPSENWISLNPFPELQASAKSDCSVSVSSQGSELFQIFPGAGKLLESSSSNHKKTNETFFIEPSETVLSTNDATSHSNGIA